jgi:hypothetical protein
VSIERSVSLSNLPSASKNFLPVVTREEDILIHLILWSRNS